MDATNSGLDDSKFSVGTQACPDSSGITIVPFKEQFGAYVLGFDFDARRPDQVAAIEEAYLRYDLLLFRGYTTSAQQQVEFTKLFGKLWYHPRQTKGLQGAHETLEEILVIGNEEINGHVAGILSNDELAWHTDSCFIERPPGASVLRAEQLPSFGGNTHFVNMYSVYKALPDKIRGHIEGRTIQFDLLYDGAGKERAGQPAPTTDDIRVRPNIRHPIVCTHEKTCRNFVNIGPEPNAKNSWIVGLPWDESQTIISQIFEIVHRAEHQFTLVWQEGDLVLWDNLSIMHRRGTWPANETRVITRTSTEGHKQSYVK